MDIKPLWIFIITSIKCDNGKSLHLQRFYHIFDKHPRSLFELPSENNDHYSVNTFSFFVEFMTKLIVKNKLRYFQSYLKKNTFEQIFLNIFFAL